MSDPRRVDNVEAMNHLNPAGALSGLDLDDNEGMAIRAAVDVVGLSRDPPVTGNAAIRAALKDYLIGLGFWPEPDVGVDE